MNRVYVTVTQKDILEGRQRSNYTCPVALAIGRTLGRVVDIREYIEVKNFRGPFSEIVDWIASYDMGEKVDPFTFILDI